MNKYNTKYIKIFFFKCAKSRNYNFVFKACIKLKSTKHSIYTPTDNLKVE